MLNNVPTTAAQCNKTKETKAFSSYLQEADNTFFQFFSFLVEEVPEFKYLASL